MSNCADNPYERDVEMVEHAVDELRFVDLQMYTGGSHSTVYNCVIILERHIDELRDNAERWRLEQQVEEEEQG